MGANSVQRLQHSMPFGAIVYGNRCYCGEHSHLASRCSILKCVWHFDDFLSLRQSQVLQHWQILTFACPSALKGEHQFLDAL